MKRITSIVVAAVLLAGLAYGLLASDRQSQRARHEHATELAILCSDMSRDLSGVTFKGGEDQSYNIERLQRYYDKIGEWLKETESSNPLCSPASAIASDIGYVIRVYNTALEETGKPREHVSDMQDFCLKAAHKAHDLFEIAKGQ